MATVEQLSQALVNADAAGDAGAARVLAAEITRMRQSEAAPDKYKQAAIEERDALKAKGIDTGAGLTRRLAQGATFNLADEIIAGALTPVEMFKRGINPREAYNFAKAREDLIMEDARKETGALGSALEIGGGIGTGLGAASAGLTFSRALAPNAGLAARSLASAGDSAAMGALAGFGEGNGVGDRLGNAAQGGAIGFGVGGVAPSAFSLIGQAASPILSNIRARVNPEGFARTQVGRAVVESGQNPQQLADAVAAAGREGQGMFTLADAMGNAGQRMLSSTTRAPGAGRTAVVDFLDGRQAGQGRRISNALAEGFDSPQTAAQVEARMTSARNTAADAEFGAVRADANPVDLTRAIARIDDTLTPGVNQIVTPQSNIANDSIEAALDGVRRRLTDGRSNLTDFTAVQRVRGDLSDQVEAARRAGQGNRARLLGQVLREMDTAMEAASAGHRQANANFAQASRNIEAVDQGRTAALRGRTEDTIPQFRGLTPEGQQAFRSGYVDPLISQTQGAAFGVNKARPLINDAFADEAAVMAPGNQLMQSRIGRENTMFQTRNAALGNSKTAENLADDAAMGIDPSVIGTMVAQVGSGNWGGALRSALSAGQNAWTGNTAQVREAVANILLQRGQNVNPASIQRVLDETVRRIQLVQQIAQQLGRGGSGGLAIAPSATGNR